MNKSPNDLQGIPSRFAVVLMVVLALSVACQKSQSPQTEHANSGTPASTPTAVLQPGTAPGTDSKAAGPATSSAIAEPAPKDGPAAIPIRAGLTIVTALADTNGDYESIKRVVKTSADEVVFSYKADQPTNLNVERTVLRKDMENAHEYRRWFYLAFEKYPGTTAIGTSASVLKELKTKGESAFRVEDGGSPSNPGEGVLHRVEEGAVPVPVIVNDERVLLRAIHAQGIFNGYKADFYFLDDEQNPMCLRFKIGINKLNVVKIAFTPEEGTSDKSERAARLEQQLEQTGRAEIYGIYFDFASARIKEESTPVLQEINAVLTKNPSWKLNIAGHTDNIGGDAYNLELSRKRAAAVKEALVSQYHIDGGRLETAGFGAGQPKENNDTIEGRARNRRVELVRQ
jgi:OOP family OmpA-OmpF porin